MVPQLLFQRRRTVEPVSEEQADSSAFQQTSNSFGESTTASSSAISRDEDVVIVSSDDEEDESNQLIDEKTTSSSQYSFYYLSPHAAQELPRFQYRGQDLSLLYKYILSPLAQFCVDQWTPRSIAPNSITLIGLSFMIAAYTIIWMHVPSMDSTVFDESPPNWIYLCNAVALLLYQTLDNMDGKQARRTGSSSPMGLLFDHGCDAINSLFGSANWMIAMALHPQKDALLCWIILFGPYALFYIGTWEEYFTGALIMPIINGPNEGLLGGALMSLTSYWYGSQFWHESSWWNVLQPHVATLVPSLTDVTLRNCDLLVAAAMIGFVQEVVSKIVLVMWRYGSRVLWNLLPFATLIACSTIIGCHKMELWVQAPRLCLHLIAILFVEMTTALMLAHMSDERYQCFRWTLLPLVILTAGVTFGYIDDVESCLDYLLAYTAGAGVYLLFKTVLIIHEISTLLNIWCFDIVTPRRRQPSAAYKISTRGKAQEMHMKAE